MLPDISEHDLAQRYKGSWIRASINDVDKIIRIDYISKQGIQTQGRIPFLSGEVDIVQEFPEMGLVNLEKSVHVVSRKPIRQWCRGLKPELLFDVCRTRHEMPLHSRIDEARATALFHRKWIVPDVGIPQIKKQERFSFAMNNKYWFSGNATHLYVWRNQSCIGELIKDRMFYFNESTLLQEEVNTDLKGIYAD